MATTPQNVRDIAPEYAGLADEQIAPAVAAASAQIDPVVWGDIADVATRLLAAHTLSITYPVIRGTEKDSERYLKEFERLRGGLALTPLVL